MCACLHIYTNVCQAYACMFVYACLSVSGHVCLLRGIFLPIYTHISLSTSIRCSFGLLDSCSWSFLHQLTCMRTWATSFRIAAAKADTGVACDYIVSKAVVCIITLYIHGRRSLLLFVLTATATTRRAETKTPTKTTSTTTTTTTTTKSTICYYYYYSTYCVSGKALEGSVSGEATGAAEGPPGDHDRLESRYERLRRSRDARV